MSNKTERLARLTRTLLKTGPKGFIRIKADGYLFAVVSGSSGMNNADWIAQRIVQLWNVQVEASNG